MADRSFPISWPASLSVKEVTKWFNKENTWLRDELKNALHTVERRTGFPAVYQIPGGLPAATETAGKHILGANFGTTLADTAVKINGVTATVTAVAAGDITFTCPNLGLVAGDVVVVEVSIGGVKEKLAVAVA